MNLPGLNLNDISQYQLRLDLVKLTAEQLTKDFEIFGFDITFSGKNETAYLELTDQIFPIIEHLFKTDYSKLMSLMYKIDLNENQIKSVIKDFKQEEIIAEITHLILERELKKVVIRQYFKNQQNQG